MTGPRSLVWLLLSLVCTSSCGAQRVWYGRTPDRARMIEVWSQGSHQWLEEAGRMSPLYRGVGVDALVFSPDSARLAYPARRGDGWVLVVDGRETRAWRGIGEVVFSPDSQRLAYAAESDDGWQVVVDGRAGPRFDALMRGTLAFSPESTHLAYVGQRDGAVHVVLDQVPGAPYDGIGELSFSGDGAHLVYLARRGAQAYVVIDGVRGPPYERIRELRVGPGGRVGYLADAHGGTVAVIDGVESAPSERARSLVFSPDGRHHAYAALRGGVWTVVRDSRAGEGYEDIAEGSLAFAPDGSRLAYHGARAGRWFLVVGQREFGPYDGLGPVVFAADGARWGAIGHRHGTAEVLVDGQVIDTADWAGNLVFHAHQQGFAYLTADQDGMVVHADERSHRFAMVVDGSLMFSRDGRHWACVAMTDDTGAYWLVIDGVRRQPFDVGEVVHMMSDDPFAAMLSTMLSTMLSDDLEERVQAMVRADVEALLASDSRPDEDPRVASALIPVQRIQPRSAGSLSMPRGGLTVAGELRFLTAPDGPRLARTRFTDIVLFRPRVRYGLTPRIAVSAAMAFLPKSAPAANESVWQGLEGGIDMELTPRWALSARAAGGLMMNGVGYWGQAEAMAQLNRRLGSSLMARTGLGVSGLFLGFSGADGQPFREVALRARSRLLYHRRRTQLSSWFDIEYQLPLAHDDGVLDPDLGVALESRRRLRGAMGMALRFLAGWDVYFQVAVTVGDEADPPASSVPILDGGFAQRQYILGLVRRYRIDGRGGATY